MIRKYTKIINVGQPFYHYCRFIGDVNDIGFGNRIGYADLRVTVVRVR
jgi:hypothetical protein